MKGATSSEFEVLPFAVVPGACVKREYLGDSYDVVKRLWRELFGTWAPLYAEPRFIPSELQCDFTRLTGIAMLDAEPPATYCVLNDPDTGIRAPHGTIQTEGRTHIALSTIVEQCNRPGVQVVITFDQSSHRTAGLSGADQRVAKLRRLALSRIQAFYYVSHAPFLFASSSSDALMHARELIQAAGMPVSRLEHDG